MTPRKSSSDEARTDAFLDPDFSSPSTAAHEREPVSARDEGHAVAVPLPGNGQVAQPAANLVLGALYELALNSTRWSQLKMEACREPSERVAIQMSG